LILEFKRKEKELLKNSGGEKKKDLLVEFQ
jgi:hypothetical protein